MAQYHPTARAIYRPTLELNQYFCTDYSSERCDNCKSHLSANFRIKSMFLYRLFIWTGVAQHQPTARAICRPTPKLNQTPISSLRPTWRWVLCHMYHFYKLFFIFKLYYYLRWFRITGIGWLSWQENESLWTSKDLNEKEISKTYFFNYKRRQWNDDLSFASFASQRIRPDAY